MELRIFTYRVYINIFTVYIIRRVKLGTAAPGTPFNIGCGKLNCRGRETRPPIKLPKMARGLDTLPHRLSLSKQRSAKHGQAGENFSLPDPQWTRKWTTSPGSQVRNVRSPMSSALLLVHLAKFIRYIFTFYSG